MASVENIFDEGCLRFHFPADWYVSHYDKTTFYREKLEKVGGDSKAMDFVAQSPDGALWLIEVKDFRKHRIENKERITSGDLVKEVVVKALDTVAGLWISYYQQDEALARFTTKLKPDQPIRVMLWLEENPPPTNPRTAKQSRLNPRQKPQVDMEDALRRRLKPIGLKGKLGSMLMHSKLGWTVENIPGSLY